MNSTGFLIFAVVFAVALIIFYQLQRKEADISDQQAGTAEGTFREDTWASARDTDSTVDRFIASASRPFSVLPTVANLEQSSIARIVQAKLLASGNTFGNSVEVFFSVQVFAFCLSALTALLAFAVTDTAIKVALLILVLVFALYPWNLVNTKAKKRSHAITKALPDFVEILQMPIEAGSGGVVAALSFTADRTTGPVSDAVKDMVLAINTRTLSTAEAFSMAGDRLGTPDAKAFFNAMLQSYLEGARVSETIAAQAVALRSKAFDQRIAEINKLPNKLLFIMALHLLPFIFLLVLIPTFLALGNF